MTAVLKNLDESMSEIVNEMSPMSLQDRFDSLMQEFIAFAFYLIDRQKKTGKRMEDHERLWQEDSMKQLRMIERIFYMALKNGRIVSKPNADFDSQVIDKIRSMQSTVGDIVQKLPQPPQKKTDI